MPASARRDPEAHEETPSAAATDERLLAIIGDRSADDDFWSSRARDRSDSGHGIFQYPAMMVPEVQRRLLGAVIEASPALQSLYDPFVGSGTSLVSAMHFGLEAHGNDINPLAVLLSRLRTARSVEFTVGVIAEQVVARARDDTKSSIETTMPNRTKWFQDQVAIDLSKLRRSIRACDGLWVRRFLWATLAETVRLTSNDRTSTYKLHARRADDIGRRRLSPLNVFLELATDNAKSISTFRRRLREAGKLTGGKYKRNTSVLLADTRRSGEVWSPRTFDIIMTSPPYGDNRTTVTYGQHSYLPLHWIDFPDIDRDADVSAIRTTHELDSRSLGGRGGAGAWDEEQLFAASPKLEQLAQKLSSAASDGRGRLTRFYGHFAQSLEQIIQLLAPRGYMIWTVGNRSIGGLQVPTDEILSEVLSELGCTVVTVLRRTIHHKRMPNRNATSPTMKEEKILLVRRSGF